MDPLVDFHSKKTHACSLVDPSNRLKRNIGLKLAELK